MEEENFHWLTENTTEMNVNANNEDGVPIEINDGALTAIGLPQKCR